MIKLSYLPETTFFRCQEDPQKAPSGTKVPSCAKNAMVSGVAGRCSWAVFDGVRRFFPFLGQELLAWPARLTITATNQYLVLDCRALNAKC